LWPDSKGIVLSLSLGRGGDRVVIFDLLKLIRYRNYINKKLLAAMPLVVGFTIEGKQQVDLYRSFGAIDL